MMNAQRLAIPSSGLQNWSVMSPGSPAEIIPFERFLARRQRLLRIAAANGTVVVPASTDVGIQLEGPGTWDADDGASPGRITDRPRRCRTAARPSPDLRS